MKVIALYAGDVATDQAAVADALDECANVDPALLAKLSGAVAKV